MVAFIIALLLLTTDLDAKRLDFCRPELKLAAVSVEILDPREVIYVLVKPGEWLSDLAMIRRRAGEIREAPRLWEVDKFDIDRDTIGKLLLVNKELQKYLDECLPLYPVDAVLLSTIDETKRLYEVWDTLRDAKTLFYYAHIRRRALARLHSLGIVDLSTMPYFVPLRRYSVVR